MATATQVGDTVIYTGRDGIESPALVTITDESFDARRAGAGMAPPQPGEVSLVVWRASGRSYPRHGVPAEGSAGHGRAGRGRPRRWPSRPCPVLASLDLIRQTQEPGAGHRMERRGSCMPGLAYGKD